MRVTTELKNLIKRSFDEKRAKVSNEARDEASKAYDDIISSIETSKEFKTLVKAGNAFREKFDDTVKREKTYDSDELQWYTGSGYESLKDIKATDFVRNNVDSFLRNNVDIAEESRRKRKELDLAQESLLIKLTYEKDLDKIREMLAEYEITI